MKINKRLLPFFGLLAFIALARPGACDPAPIPATHLHVLAGDGIRCLTDTEALCDFGSVSALDAAQITRTFTLKNDGAAPLTISRLQPSCFCTSASIDSDTLAPGRQAPVRVTVNTTHLAPGQLEKMVQVFVQGDEQPVATLEMTGELRPALSFSPALLDFGSVSPGKAPFRTLTVTWDPRLMSQRNLPALTSPDPRVRVTALPAGKMIGMGILTRVYQITLARDASPGPLDVTLAFALPSEKPGSPVLSAPALSAFTSAFALVVGKIGER